jgi:hypothetical protein
MSRVTLAFGSFRRSVCRICASFVAHLWLICGSFVAHLSRPFRATDVRGWPFTQGGAPRLRCLALPWANLFCPFGAGRFLDAWPVSAGLVVLRVPADVIRPHSHLKGARKKKPRAERRGGAATRLPVVARPPIRFIALKGRRRLDGESWAHSIAEGERVFTRNRWHRGGTFSHRCRAAYAAPLKRLPPTSFTAEP